MKAIGDIITLLISKTIESQRLICNILEKHLVRQADNDILHRCLHRNSPPIRVDIGLAVCKVKQIVDDMILMIISWCSCLSCSQVITPDMI